MNVCIFSFTSLFNTITEVEAQYCTITVVTVLIKKHKMKIVSFETFFSVINSLCALAFIVQMCIMVADFLDPSDLNTITYQLKLHQIPFPVKFKLCAIPGFKQSMLMQYGYLVNNFTYFHIAYSFLKKDIPAYFHGQSRLNNSIYGWTGHSLKKSKLLSRLGKYIRIRIFLSDILSI